MSQFVKKDNLFTNKNTTLRGIYVKGFIDITVTYIYISLCNLQNIFILFY